MTWLFVLTVVALLMSRQLVELYLGETYSCPACGTTDQDGHADECPWRR